MSDQEIAAIMGRAVALVLLVGIPLFFAIRIRSSIGKVLLIALAIILVAASLAGSELP